MLMLADRPWPQRIPGIQRFRELYASYNGVAAPPVVTADQCIRAPAAAEANELAERHMASFVDSNPRALRAHEHPLRHRQGLRRLRQEVGNRRHRRS
jgi:hypothetical protein